MLVPGLYRPPQERSRAAHIHPAVKHCMARKICGFSRRLARRDNAIWGRPTDPPITHAERTLYVLSHVNDIAYRHTPREQHHLDLPGRLEWLFDHGIAHTAERALVAPVMAGQQALSLQEIDDLLKFVQHIDRRELLALTKRLTEGPPTNMKEEAW
jgi:hypothetical protein